MGIISDDSVIMKQERNFKRIDLRLEKEMALEKNKSKVLDAQRNQLMFGIGSDGKKIKPSYANDDYAFDKNTQNALAGFGNPDLNLTGALHKSLDLEIGTSDDYFIFSGLKYFNSLDEKYDTAFDLSKKNKKNIPEVNNDYLKSVHKKINQ